MAFSKVSTELLRACSRFGIGDPTAASCGEACFVGVEWEVDESCRLSVKSWIGCECEGPTVGYVRQLFFRRPGFITIRLRGAHLRRRVRRRWTCSRMLWPRDLEPWIVKLILPVRYGCCLVERGQVGRFRGSGFILTDSRWQGQLIRDDGMFKYGDCAAQLVSLDSQSGFRVAKTDDLGLQSLDIVLRSLTMGPNSRVRSVAKRHATMFGP